MESYKNDNRQIFSEKFNISGDFLEEIYEMLDFADKSQLRLFPIEEMNKQINGQDYLCVFEYNEGTPPKYGVECVLFEAKEHLGYILGSYHTDEHFPKFEFCYFIM